MSRPLQPSDYSAHVRTIRVVVESAAHSYQADTHHGNHASIYLILADGRSAIHLNMIKTGPTETWGSYQTNHCDYTEPSSALRHWDLKAHDGLEVKDILELIEKKKRYKYELAHHGTGARAWVQKVIKDMKDKKCVDKHGPADVDEVVEGLCYSVNLKGEYIPEAVNNGRFH